MVVENSATKKFTVFYCNTFIVITICQMAFPFFTLSGRNSKTPADSDEEVSDAVLACKTLAVVADDITNSGRLWSQTLFNPAHFRHPDEIFFLSAILQWFGPRFRCATDAEGSWILSAPKKDAEKHRWEAAKKSTEREKNSKSDQEFGKFLEKFWKILGKF